MSKIVLVPTPIGNLGDITLRALEVLKSCTRIAAEDTRKTGILLKHFGIIKPMISLHAHNEHGRLPSILAQLKNEDGILAVTSDAGTPGISDPGFLLVREAIKEGIEVECLPGPVALIPALVNSGLPIDRFVFEGFLPQKKGRQTRILQLVAEPRTMVFYESPHRLIKLLTELAQHCGDDRKASVSREISKLYEETQRGSLAELIKYFSEKTVKGEIVVVLSGKE